MSFYLTRKATVFTYIKASTDAEFARKVRERVFVWSFPSLLFSCGFLQARRQERNRKRTGRQQKTGGTLSLTLTPRPHPLRASLAASLAFFCVENRQAENIKSLHRLRTFRLQKAKPSNFHIKSYYKTVLSNKRENALFLGIRIRTLTSQSVNK